MNFEKLIFVLCVTDFEMFWTYQLNNKSVNMNFQFKLVQAYDLQDIFLIHVFFLSYVFLCIILQLLVGSYNLCYPSPDP